MSQLKTNLVALLCLLTFAQAAQDITLAPVTCKLTAYVIDPDPKGLNVRSGPGKTFRVVGTLPHSDSGVIIQVIGAKDDWMLIEKPENLDDTDNKELPKLKGWVYASMLGTMTRHPTNGSVKLHHTFDARSRVVGQLADETEVRLRTCFGGWAGVEYKRLCGWLAPASQCGNPVTTCP